jgi:hypothetical protein
VAGQPPSRHRRIFLFYERGQVRENQEDDDGEIKKNEEG